MISLKYRRLQRKIASVKIEMKAGRLLLTLMLQIKEVTESWKHDSLLNISSFQQLLII